MKTMMTFKILLVFCVTFKSNGFTPLIVNKKTESTRLLSSKIGVFFGSSTGATELAAELIVEKFGSEIAEGPFEIDTLQGNLGKKLDEYEALIVGTPTWNTGADTERSGTGWDEVYYGEMQDLNVSGRKIAVFGLGDQMSYGENYADASGELYDVFENLGCKMMGHTSQEGYEHEASKAIRGSSFCGLLLDAVNQEDQTESRVKNWVVQLIEEGILDSDKSINESPITRVNDNVISETDTAESIIASLKEENSALKRKLEENSLLLESNLFNQPDVGFTPHYNHFTGSTMWTSQDGRSCYYTSDTPVNP